MSMAGVALWRYRDQQFLAHQKQLVRTGRQNGIVPPPSSPIIQAANVNKPTSPKNIQNPLAADEIVRCSSAPPSMLQAAQNTIDSVLYGSPPPRVLNKTFQQVGKNMSVETEQVESIPVPRTRPGFSTRDSDSSDEIFIYNTGFVAPPLKKVPHFTRPVSPTASIDGNVGTSKNTRAKSPPPLSRTEIFELRLQEAEKARKETRNKRRRSTEN